MPDPTIGAAGVAELKVGDRVVVTCIPSCGEYLVGSREFHSGCERSSPNEEHASFLTTRRASPEDGPDRCKTFRDRQEGCLKVVLKS